MENIFADWQKPFMDVLSHYKGKITSEPGALKIVANNPLIDHKGLVKKVECSIQVRQSFIVDPHRFQVWAEEKTLEILGGSSCGSMTKAEAIDKLEKQLEKYRFKRTEAEQMTLF